MRATLWLGLSVLAAPLVVLVLLIAILAGGSAPRAAGASRCAASAPDGEVAGFGAKSLQIASTIVAVGKRRGVPAKGWLIAIMAGIVESGLRNLHHGHADSLGVFQQRPSAGWGSPEEILDVEYAVNQFYNVLLNVDGWRQMPLGVAAQTVQRSAYPDRYQQVEQQARNVLRAVQGAACSASAPSVAAVIAAAKSQLGVPYAWGGGTVNGPSEGFGIDEGVVGFDCSSLVMFAYYQGTGGKVSLPRVAAAQYQATADHAVSPAQLRPGDLLFYGPTPAGIHHVAMYLGAGKMIEAPHSGTVVQISPVRLGGDFYAATRVM